MKTDLEVEVEVDLRHLGKVIIFRDKQTDRTFLLYIDLGFQVGFYGSSRFQIGFSLLQVGFCGLSRF